MEKKSNRGVFEATFVALAKNDPEPVRTIENLNYYDYIPFGQDNLYPQALALFARTSPNHRGILNSKENYIIGDGIFPVNEDDKETWDLISRINYEGETLTDVVRKILVDDLRFGNAYWEVITDQKRSFLWLSQIDSTKVRLAKDLKSVLIHPHWGMYQGKDDKYLKSLPLYPNFVPDRNEDYSAYRSVYHMKQYEPEFVYYGLPEYIAGQDSIQIDLKTNKWNLARLKNAFRVSGILVIPVRDKAESKAVIDRIKRDHIGEDNQAKLLTITKQRARSDEKADQTQLIETNQNDEGSWEKLHEQSLGDMVIAHNWYRSLIGKADNTGFDTQRILNEYEMALNSTITNHQSEYLNIIKRLYREVVGKEIDIHFKNRAPIDNDNYYRIWELRKMKGLDYDEKDPAQNVIVLGDKQVLQLTSNQPAI